MSDKETEAGKKFLACNPAYKIQSSQKNGAMSLQLIIKTDTALGDIVICNLDMSDIYAQCSPTKIIPRLDEIANEANVFSHIMVNEIRALEEYQPSESQPDTPF